VGSLAFAFPYLLEPVSFLSIYSLCFFYVFYSKVGNVYASSFLCIDQVLIAY